MTENTSANIDQTEQELDSRQRYERIGAELRQRREALCLDQADVARQLHLPGIVVNDIETGQVGKLSGLYRRGYIRNYARLLGLDADAVLADAGEDVPPELQEVLPVSSREWRLERYLKIASYVIVTVAIVPPLAYFFIAGGTRLLEREAESGPPPALTQQAAGQERGQPSLDSGESDTAAGVESEPARHVSASALPLNPVRPVRTPEQEAAIEVADPSAAEADVVAPDAAPAASSLQLQLLEDSWIEIHDADGDRLEYDLLRSGQTRNYEGRAPFQVLIGRSSAVNLTINGRAVTWEGHDSGDVAELAVDADGGVRR